MKHMMLIAFLLIPIPTIFAITLLMTFIFQCISASTIRLRPELPSLLYVIVKCVCYDFFDACTYQKTLFYSGTTQYGNLVLGLKNAAAVNNIGSHLRLVSES